MTDKPITIADIQGILEERDSFWKLKFMELLKTTSLDENAIQDEEYRKWYKFGAYDFGAKLSDRIKEL